MKSLPLTLILLTLLLAVTLPVPVAAQTRQWTAQPGTSNGTLQWSSALDSTVGVYATGVAVSGSDVYVTGSTCGDLDGSGPGIEYGAFDAFLAKYDGASGTLQWTRQFGTNTTEYSNGVSVDSSSNIYIVGAPNGDLDGRCRLQKMEMLMCLSRCRCSGYSAMGQKVWSVSSRRRGKRSRGRVEFPLCGRSNVRGSRRPRDRN